MTAESSRHCNIRHQTILVLYAALNIVDAIECKFKFIFDACINICKIIRYLKLIFVCFCFSFSIHSIGSCTWLRELGNNELNVMPWTYQKSYSSNWSIWLKASASHLWIWLKLTPEMSSVNKNECISKQPVCQVPGSISV